MVDRRMLERMILEKKRRIEMESLRLRLISLLPLDESNQEDPFDRAATYVKNLEERVKMLRQIRDIERSVLEKATEIRTGTVVGTEKVPVPVPVVAMRRKEKEVEIVMVSSAERRLRFHEVVHLLEREGVCMTNGTQSLVGDTVLHAIHTEANPELEYHALLMDKLKALAQ